MTTTLYHKHVNGWLGDRYVEMRPTGPPTTEDVDGETVTLQCYRCSDCGHEVLVEVA